MSRTQGVIETTKKLIAKLPSLAAVAGGWIPLFKTLANVIKLEGMSGVTTRLRRIGGVPSDSPYLLSGGIEIDVRFFGGCEVLEASQELNFEIVDPVRVSIIVPVFNKLKYTIECLAAISRHPQKSTFEIIVVDDCSTDESGDVLSAIPGIRYHRNESNEGFVRSCNAALRLVAGEYVYLLNNDTQVQANWLDALVERLDKAPRIGLVGSMLLCEDGRLQEAGARIVKQPAGMRPRLIGHLVGYGERPSSPKYRYAREVEYCSGASLLVRYSVLEDLGGLDEAYAPAYFEDVDLAYEARRLGYSVYYEPRSVVVHHLSVSMAGEESRKLELIERNAAIFMSKWGEQFNDNQKIRALAFYLPQYHPIPENDKWWGKGFTEWRNVAKARPNFPGHYQPHLPADIGFYDLRVPEVRQQQADLARENGISGFCYYYYWFNGERLLNRPLDEVLSSGEPDFPFCLCWANENWTRTWDGRDSEILMAQSHSAESDAKFINSILPILRDPRYVRLSGRPLVIVYKADLLPSPASTADIWREQCRESGIGEIFLACVHNKANPSSNLDPRRIGFDAAIEFPPLGKGVYTTTPQPPYNPQFKGLCYDYALTSRRVLELGDHAFRFFRGVMPSWDNTARRQDSSHVFLGASPHEYGRWLEQACEWTAELHFGDERLVFINAWNEWAEGNHLEPDLEFGHGYLEATRSVMDKYG